jgi:hypothetical protein
MYKFTLIKYLIKIAVTRAGGMAQVVDYLPSKHEVPLAPNSQFSSLTLEILELAAPVLKLSKR